MQTNRQYHYILTTTQCLSSDYLFADHQTQIDRAWTESARLSILIGELENKMASAEISIEVGMESKPRKSVLIAYLWWFPLGLVGAHRHYLGSYFHAYLYMFSLGYCGLGWLIDAFFIPAMVKEANDGLEKESTSSCKVRQCNGCSEAGLRYGMYLSPRNVRDTLILILNPLGILGKKNRAGHNFPGHDQRLSNSAGQMLLLNY